jgi:hypothetical protein
MALYLISYDIADKDKAEYQSLWDALGNMEATKILYSEWVVPGDPGTAADIYESLSPLIRESDRLLVQELAANAAWDKLLISDASFKAAIGKHARF